MISLKKHIWGTSVSAMQLLEEIEIVSPTNLTVIISGESGTGKEYAANAIHAKSQRHDKPFIAIDCGSLSDELAGSELFGHEKGAFTGALSNTTGQFEMANGGTLFLDEIANLSPSNQTKLLRVLQEREIKKIGSTKHMHIDIRLIVASNEDIEHAVHQGKFREDLFHRLNEFCIRIEPLRKRRTDIPAFVNHFIKEASADMAKQVYGVDDDAMDELKQFNWPGNVRELRNVVRRSVLAAKSGIITQECLPTDLRIKNKTSPKSNTGKYHVNGGGLGGMMEEVEKDAIIQVLSNTFYDVSKAAEVLKIHRRTLYNKMKQHGIQWRK